MIIGHKRSAVGQASAGNMYRVSKTASQRRARGSGGFKHIHRYGHEVNQTLVFQETAIGCRYVRAPHFVGLHQQLRDRQLAGDQLQTSAGRSFKKWQH